MLHNDKGVSPSFSDADASGSCASLLVPGPHLGLWEPLGRHGDARKCQVRSCHIRSRFAVSRSVILWQPLASSSLRLQPSIMSGPQDPAPESNYCRVCCVICCLFVRVLVLCCMCVWDLAAHLSLAHEILYRSVAMERRPSKSWSSGPKHGLMAALATTS